MNSSNWISLSRSEITVPEFLEGGKGRKYSLENILLNYKNVNK